MKKIIIMILVLCILVTNTSCNRKNIIKENATRCKYEMVATWINYFEISEIVNNAETQIQFEEYVYDIISEIKEFNINVIFLQVRAFDDAFYDSDICPISEYCKNENNELKFDVLKTFIDICKKENIDLHAWINPYRIRNDNNINMINHETYAYDILQDDTKDERLVITDNSIYYNPAYYENQKYILDCIREIIRKYDVQGVHIDDYFYSSTSKNIDKKIYNQYLENGGVLTISDYRRNCINTLVSSIYQITSDNNLTFSISPCGDMDKNYNELYADVKYWSTNSGFADYIIPQLYYGFENDFMPYVDVFNEWIQLKNNSNKIIIALPLYKIGQTDSYAGKGNQEFIKNKDTILKQMKYSEKYNIDGFAFYSSSFLYKNVVDEEQIIVKNLIIKHMKENW